MTIVALKGRKGSGKSYIANILCGMFGYKKLAFGDHVKDIGRVMMNFSDEQLYGSEKDKVDPEWGISPREWMQWFATDVVREQLPKLGQFKHGDTFWVRPVIRKLHNIYARNPSAKIVVDDVRFVNEYNGLFQFCNAKESTLKVLHVDRHGDSSDAHKSETEMLAIPCHGLFDNHIGITPQELFTELMAKIPV